jgi:hypothetical protein
MFGKEVDVKKDKPHIYNMTLAHEIRSGNDEGARGY